MKRLIPDEVLDQLPLRYRFLDQIILEGRPVEQRVSRNKYYDTEATVCRPNYRRTSKLYVNEKQ